MSRNNGTPSNHSTRWLGVHLVALLLVCAHLSHTVSGKRPVKYPKVTPKLQPRADDLRLPTSVIPEHYRLKVIPYIFEGNFTFDGEVTINVRCDSSTSNITLHLNMITIDETSVIVQSLEDGANIQVASHSYDERKQFYIIELSEALQPGSKYSVYLRYIGLLTSDEVGLYRSSYVEGNTTKWLAVTDFESADARRAFPSFDEPAMKAVFEISVGRDSSSKFTSISNADLKETVPMEDHPGWVWDNFNETPRMSTYLVAITVSEFANATSSPELSNAVYRVWARNDLIEFAAYANDFGPRSLTFFEEYFNIPYPLPKQDLVGIPQFQAGAMENWGMITFREGSLLYDPATNTARNKYGVTTTIAHETAHEWTGDLVTIRWWSDIWLNEGFASFLENLAVGSIYPTWKMDHQFQLDKTYSIMQQDALETSHPIIVDVSEPEEIQASFDGITYDKGASIIRMMEGFLTPATFRQGMTNYLTTFGYGNALQDDLFNELTLQAHADGTLSPEITVKQIMDTWTLQMGFPLVTVTRDYVSGRATVSQKRFLSGQSGSVNDTHDYLWWVPLSFADQTSDTQDPTPREWLQEEREKIIFGLPDENSWVLFNLRETGYYRVNYDQRNWELLAAQLESDPGIFDANNRAKMMNDAINLVNTNQLDYLTFLSLTRYLDKELEYVSWQTALDALNYIKTMFLFSDGFFTFREYMVQKIEPVYYTVTVVELPDEAIVQTFLRTAILPWACELGVRECLLGSFNLYEQWMNEVDPDANNPTSVNLKSTIYCNGIKEGSVEEWDFAWERYLATSDGSERNTLLSAMGCSDEVWILNRYLERIIDETSGLSNQDGNRVISAVAAHPIGQTIAFNFVRNNWQAIVNSYSVSTAASMIATVSSNMNSQQDLDELISFRAEHLSELGESVGTIDQAIARVQSNLDWMNKNFATIEEWFATNTPSTKHLIANKLKKIHLQHVKKL